MEMRGKQMQGWLRVAADDVRTKRQLERWVKLGATYARSLPPNDRGNAEPTASEAHGCAS